MHSVRYRIKDSEHLIEKIIRKKIESPELEFTLENYTETINDIIGVRALHLYKNDWKEIAEFIKTTWDFKEKPTVYIRKGDTSETPKSFENKEYNVKEHQYGYRSIHYIIESKPTKAKFISELQVRTIFEEGWSEIDHDLRYPYDLENPILKEYLSMFNRLAGSADEMGTYIKFLQMKLSDIDKQHDSSIKERDKIINDLKSKIEKLEGNKLLKTEINNDLNKLFDAKTIITAENFSQTNYINPLTLKNSYENVFLNLEPIHSILPESPESIFSTYLTKKICDECSTEKYVLGSPFHTCPICKKYLCNNCWPHGVIITSVEGNSIRTDKCPNCVKQEK